MSALERFGVCDDTVTTLDMGSAGIRVRESDIIDVASELQVNRQIVFMNASGVELTVEGAAALGRAISKSEGSKSVMQYLKLDNCEIRPEIMRAFVDGIGPEGAITRLEILDLSNNPLRDEGATILAEYLAKHNCGAGGVGIDSSAPKDVSLTGTPQLTSHRSLPSDTTKSPNSSGMFIRTLELKACKIGLQGAAALGKMLGTTRPCRITTLSLDKNKLKFAGVQEICNGLVSNTTLRLLNLNDNGINTEGGDALARMLRENKHVETLQVGNNYLSTSLPAIAQSLCQRGTCARLLDFSTNRINSETCLLMSQVLEGHQFYASCLSLEGNPIGDTGLVALFHAVKGTPLQFLDLSETGITAASSQVLADLVQLCPMLCSLQIDGNVIGDKGLLALMKEIGSSKALVTLNVERCGLGPLSLSELANSIVRQRRMRSLTLAENKVDVLPVLDALCACRTMKYLDLSDLNIQDSEDVLRALVGVMAANPDLELINLEHNPIAHGFPDETLTRQIAMEMAADISIFNQEPGSVVGINNSRVGTGGVLVNQSGASNSSVGGSKNRQREVAAAIFKPKWATCTAVDIRPEDDDSDGEDGADIPLVPHPLSLQHPLYPGYGKGRFSSGSFIQNLSDPVPYTIRNSNGYTPPIIPTADGTAALRYPLRRPLKYAPYSLHALEANKSQLPITEDLLRKKFDELDVDGNGFLDRNEFMRVYLAYESFGLRPSEKEISEIMSKYNMWGDNRISFDEFAVLMLKLAQH